MVGRLNEKRMLLDFINGRSKACMVYGLRRIGKSFLIQEVLKASGRKFHYFECAEASMTANLRLFCSSAGFNPVMPAATFLDAFKELSRREGDIIVVIDEYQNMQLRQEDIGIDSIMQLAIDQCPPGMKLIFCGSYITAMKKLLKEENPLFGRFDPIIHLDAMDYLDSSLFYPRAATREKIGYYAVFGGCPYINESIDPDAGLKENITKLILPQDSKARNYIENLVFKELKKMDGVNEILAALANGKRSYSAIQSGLAGRSNGYAAERLAILEDMGIVCRNAPINDPGNKKKAYYEIRDNLIRFYYAYVFANRNAIMMLGAETFFDSYIEKSLDTFISYRFEGIARQYFSRRAKAGQLPRILDIGTYSYDDAKTKTNGEFDVALRFQDGYDIYEVKFLKEKMSSALLEEEGHKMHAIPSFKPRRIGFISASGFSTTGDGAEYITGDDIYKV